jgi:hypothetical protein
LDWIRDLHTLWTGGALLVLILPQLLIVLEALMPAFARLEQIPLIDVFVASQFWLNNFVKQPLKPTGKRIGIYVL